jgi:hypothetical protein
LIVRSRCAVHHKNDDLRGNNALATLGGVSIPATPKKKGCRLLAPLSRQRLPLGMDRTSASVIEIL